MEKQYDTILIEVSSKNEGITTTGIPFPKGQVTSLSQLKLYQANKEIENFSRPLGLWPDGSINWLNLGFFHSSIEPSQYELVITDIKTIQETDDSPPEIKLQTTEKGITVSSTRHQFVIDFESLSMDSTFEKKRLFKLPIAAELILEKEQKARGKLNHWSSHVFQDINRKSDSAIELVLEGTYEYPTNKLKLQFKTHITLHAAIPFVKVDTTIHNPNPARHPGGVWDQGDEGAELFNSASFNLNLTENNIITYQTTQNEEWLTAKPNTLIKQHASGGENWQSPVHVDKDNRVTLKTNGFEVSNDDIKLACGDRASPIIHSTNGVGLSIEKFWQNFPTSIEINNNTCQVSLFPHSSETPYELQGGEKKTHTFWLSLNNQTDRLDWIHSPPTTKPAITWLTKGGALPTFIATTKSDGIANLIRAGLESKQNFFAKRETIDEYGWRNFGDLYADHETAGYEGDELFISHYNNQYDPIYGFLRQFLLSGDSRWFELADDLTKHVKDIDIYHTTGDKAELNGGLFWHTDHYCKAHTATHRSHSKLQPIDAYRGRQGGGGPGGQHCYTTGLTYHYFLTGSESSKQVVLALTKWITNVYEGKNTCIELLLAVKRRKAPGYKNHLNGQYSFDRGTAYYIVALLDSYQLTQDLQYLQRAEHVIKNTIHPADDINSRDLSNIEGCWYYTVFLQAVCRYLEIKETYNQLDDSFYYARDTLLHYAEWMLSNEYPYLEKPEILDFPNDTWTAQELRKTHVLAAAFYYSTKNKQAYLDKAKYFYDYIVAQLTTSKELSYTRILVLLMQSHGPLEYYTAKGMTTDFAKCNHNWPAPNYQQNPGLVISVIKALGKRLLKFSITNEINWLKTHVGR